MGVNHQKYDRRNITSSRTLPAHQLSRAGREGGARQLGLQATVSLTTIHSYTNDQADPRSAPQGPAAAPAPLAEHHPDDHWRRQSDEPRDSEVKGKIDGISLRVPTPDVSVWS